MIKLLLLSLSVLLIVKLSTAAFTINTVAQWNSFDFKFPSTTIEQNARNSGEYVPGNSLAIDVAVFNNCEASRKKVFVTFPRFGKGVPFSLGVISNEMGISGYKILPYPDYATQSATNCNGIINSFRVAIDECNRLWVVDSGSIAGEQICPAKIIVFDLNTDTKMFTYYLADKDYNLRISNLVTPIVVVDDPPSSGGTCRQTMLYIADVTGSIIVFDYLLSRTSSTKPTWVAQNKYMYPVPNYSDFIVAKETFNFMDGVLGMAVSPKTDAVRKLYFHALASGTENVVDLKILNDGASWRANKNAYPTSFYEIGSRGNQSAAEVMDKNGNLFFGLMEPTSIACWNSKKPYTKANIRILATGDALQFTSGMKIVINTAGYEELWFLTNRLQKFMSGTMKSTEVNYRILSVLIQDFIGGTQC